MYEFTSFFLFFFFAIFYLVISSCDLNVVMHEINTFWENVLIKIKI